jgi:hypothetical protein
MQKTVNLHENSGALAVECFNSLIMITYEFDYKFLISIVLDYKLT